MSGWKFILKEASAFKKSYKWTSSCSTVQNFDNLLWNGGWSWGRVSWDRNVFVHEIKS
jgi:hypothetical protein